MATPQEDPWRDRPCQYDLDHGDEVTRISRPLYQHVVAGTLFDADGVQLESLAGTKPTLEWNVILNHPSDRVVFLAATLLATSREGTPHDEHWDHHCKTVVRRGLAGAFAADTRWTLLLDYLSGVRIWTTGDTHPREIQSFEDRNRRLIDVPLVSPWADEVAQEILREAADNEQVLTMLSHFAALPLWVEVARRIEHPSREQVGFLSVSGGGVVGLLANPTLESGLHHRLVAQCALVLHGIEEVISYETPHHEHPMPLNRDAALRGLHMSAQTRGLSREGRALLLEWFDEQEGWADVALSTLVSELRAPERLDDFLEMHQLQSLQDFPQTRAAILDAGLLTDEDLWRTLTVDLDGKTPDLAFVDGWIVDAPYLCSDGQIALERLAKRCLAHPDLAIRMALHPNATETQIATLLADQTHTRLRALMAQRVGEHRKWPPSLKALARCQPVGIEAFATISGLPPHPLSAVQAAPPTPTPNPQKTTPRKPRRR